MSISNLNSALYNKQQNDSLSNTEWNAVAKTVDDLVNEVNSGGSGSNVSATSITIKNEDTNKEFTFKVNEQGDWVKTNQSKPDSEMAQVSMLGTKTTSNPNNSTFRGYAAYYTMDNPNSTKVTDVAQAATSSTTTDKIVGDRIRFASWYFAQPNQKQFDCSHDFIEIVNCGTVDFPLHYSKLCIITQNDTTKDITAVNAKNYSVHEFNLTGGVKAGSSYLIRGKSHNGSDRINIVDCDYSIGFNFQNYKIVGFVLGTKALKVVENGEIQALIKNKASNYSDKEKILSLVDPNLIDLVLFNPFFEIKNASDTSIFNTFTGCKDFTYTNFENCIIKDQFALDCAKQGFRALADTLASSQTRLGSAKTAQETIPLDSDEITFPHSLPKYAVVNYTPKSSAWHKNILTDKTKPDFVKPNMVTCSFGINGYTTRCFNWISMNQQDRDEFVFIRPQDQSASWSMYESYKGDSSEIGEDSELSMHRKKFNQEIINSVYKRIKNTFPGDSTYKYTAHKCIVYVQDEQPTGNPITYDYIVGPKTSDNKPDLSKCSDIQTFTIYPKDWKPKVYHITDQQGFTWLEYQVWAAAAEEINRKITAECNATTKLFPVLINTGDMTQNGTRINEWLDYYNAGYSLFNHIEQMSVVGNNDLCNSIKPQELGTGDDDGKSCPYYFHVFYCYEIPNDTTQTNLVKGTYTDPNGQAQMTGPLICNGVYIPSVYYFTFPQTSAVGSANNDYKFIMINSELTNVGCAKYFKTGHSISQQSTEEYSQSYAVNLYTGYKYGSTKALTALVNGSLSKTIESWLNNVNPNRTIVACHEMPFTVTTKENLTSGAKETDRSIDHKTKNLVGSHLNVFTGIKGGNEPITNDKTYWFSNMLQGKVKLCIGGHKHTYSVTYPVAEVSSGTNNIHFSKLAQTKKEKAYTDSDIQGGLFPNNNDLNNGVVYYMLQATGYKQTSNKELPCASANYAMIVPKTSYPTKTSAGSAHISQLYPMYATYEFATSDTNSAINTRIFRIVNIQKEDSSSKPIALSYQNFSIEDMFSELLLISKVDDGEGLHYENYWLSDADKYPNKTVNQVDRIWKINTNYYNNKPEINESNIVAHINDNYTLVIN